MKNYQKTKALLALLLIGFSFGLTSCLNDNDNTPIPPAAFISIYHGSPEAPSLDVFANSNRVTNTPFNYTEVLPYYRYYLGERTFKFSPYNSVTSLLEKKFTIEEDVVYSLFLTGLENSLDAILLKDEWEAPSLSNSQVRFIHLSPDAGSVDIFIEQGNTPFMDDAIFKSFSSFESLKSGVYNIRVVSKGSGETLVTANNVEIKGNRVYTVVLRGLNASGTEVDKRLNLQLITNFISN